MLKTNIKYVVGLLSAGLALSLIGCSSSPAMNHSRITLPAKNISQWVLPLDPYRISTPNSDYAESLLVEKCMEKRGIEWTIPPHDIHADQGASWNAAGRRLFNVTLASKWGYELAPSNDTNGPALRAFDLAHANMSKVEDDALTACIVLVRKNHPILMGSTQIAATYGLAADDAAKKDTHVRTAAKKWAKCMAPLGISDLPSDPEKMPSDSLISELGVTVASSPIAPVVSAKQIQVATMDAQCQLTSGYKQKYYDAEWDNELPFLTANADALERARTQLDAHNKRDLSVITQNVPNG